MDKEKFLDFLIRFGVKGFKEYNTFNAREKSICQKEYLRRLDKPTKPKTKQRH